MVVFPWDQTDAAGKVSIGNSSRPPASSDPSGLTFYPIAQYFVCVVTNPAKTGLFTDTERVEMIREATQTLRAIEVVIFDGLLVDLVERVGARAIIRGLRAVSDFEYEFQMALMNRKLREEIETVFLMPHEAYSYISSRLIK